MNNHKIINSSNLFEADVNGNLNTKNKRILNASNLIVADGGGNWNAGNKTIYNVKNPVNDGDVATKRYIKAISGKYLAKEFSNSSPTGG